MNDKLHISLGLMSGTSMDGIDAALIRTDGQNQIEELGSASLRYKPAFHYALKLAEYSVRQSQGDLQEAERLYAANATTYFTKSLGFSPDKTNRIRDDIAEYFQKEHGELPTFSQVIDHSTDLHARLSCQLMEETQAKPDLIGYHGQNLYHAPHRGITLQLGNAQRLANRTSTPVVNNFRTNDIANGGQGAPLAPLYHQALALSRQIAPTAIANCGGVANVSFILGDTLADLLGFDTGPGNGLIDVFIKQRTQGRETYDKDGHYGQRGQVIQSAFEALRSSLRGYLEAPPPKSLDIADFALTPEFDNLSIEDGCRTLEAFTAQTIVDSLDHLPPTAPPPKTWMLAGGGWQNPVIYDEFCTRLRDKCPDANITHATAVGLDAQAIEAQIFAYLAVRSIKNLPLSVPLTTGVKEPLTGGVLTHPNLDYFSP